MKKLISLLLIVIVLVAPALTVLAQDNPGCQGLTITVIHQAVRCDKWIYHGYRTENKIFTAIVGNGNRLC